jgi:hypothetical protein
VSLSVEDLAVLLEKLRIKKPEVFRHLIGLIKALTA